MNTAGFYKTENNGLFYGPNYVTGICGGNLYKEQKDSYTYPVGGWYWFESEEEARIFLNTPIPPFLPPPSPPIPAL